MADRRCALAVLVALPLLWANVDLATRFTSGGESVELRRQAWRDALAVMRDFPLAGTGLNTYGTRHAASTTPPHTDLHFQEAHNDYLQLAAEGGLLLGIPALVAMRRVRPRRAAPAGRGPARSHALLDPLRRRDRTGRDRDPIRSRVQPADARQRRAVRRALRDRAPRARYLRWIPAARSRVPAEPDPRTIAAASSDSERQLATSARSGSQPPSARFAGWRLVPALSVALALALTEGAGLILLVPLLGTIGLVVGEGATSGMAAWTGRVFATVGLTPSLVSVLAVFLAVSLLYATLYRWHLLLTPALEQQFVLALKERLYRSDRLRAVVVPRSAPDDRHGARAAVGYGAGQRVRAPVADAGRGQCRRRDLHRCRGAALARAHAARVRRRRGHAAARTRAKPPVGRSERGASPRPTVACTRW